MEIQKPPTKIEWKHRVKSEAVASVLEAEKRADCTRRAKPSSDSCSDRACGPVSPSLGVGGEGEG